MSDNQNCQTHNQPIVFIENTGEELCLFCVQKKMGNVKLKEDSEKQKQEKLEKIYLDIDHKVSNLQQLISEIIEIRTQITSSLDKIIKMIENQNSEYIEFKDCLKVQFEAKINYKINDIDQEYEKQNENQINALNIISSLFDSLKQKINYEKIIHRMNEIMFDKKNKQVEEKQKLKHYKYETFNQAFPTPKFICWSLAFNSDSTNLFAGTSNSEIIVYKLQTGIIEEEIQKITAHTSSVGCLQFLSQTNQLVSGSDDKQIIIWNQDKNQQWMHSQNLTGHIRGVSCIATNENEDWLISGSADKTIKIWVKGENAKIWKNHKSIDAGFEVLGLSLNQNGNQLITCGNQNKIHIINNLQKQWQIIQTLETVEKGYRLSFLDDNQLIFLPSTKQYIDIYDHNKKNNNYQHLKSFQISGSKMCYSYFPCQFIKNERLAIVKQGQYINLIQQTGDGELTLEESINYSDHKIFGKASNDGKYLVIWSTQGLEIRKLKQYD